MDLSKTRVLVVDDKKFMRTMAIRVLEAAGVTGVVEAGNGAEAVAAIRSAEPRIDAVFCDLIMPDMDGVEAVRHIAALPDPPALVFLSGANPALLATAAAAASARGLSVLGTIQKPISIDAARAVLANGGGSARTARAANAYDITVAEIEAAVRENQFVLHFQPKVNVASGAVEGFESLVRWNHPRHGLVPPGAFIGHAEEHRLIGPLTTAIFALAIRQSAEWARAGMATRVSVNVSSKMLDDLKLPDRFAEEAAARGIAPDRIVLEVTESGVFENEADGLEILARLHMKGFPLSIDDFGTGYSSMDQLRRIPFSELKIDRAFVNGAAQNRKARAILESSATLAASLGLKVVAEGAETDEDVELLRKTGITIVQGFVISRPLPADAVAAWLRDWQNAKVQVAQSR
ncbi:MAG: EAL domain-containing response regulator [Rhodospirillaceae bacterium]|nr:EAL domain-containing response regulator [Rhodospirillaceae bacterium]